MREKWRKDSELKDLAKSVSQSRASNTSSDDDDVDLAVVGSGSAFSRSGGYTLHALRRRLGGNDAVFPGKNQTVEGNEAEHRAEDPTERALICHIGMQIQLPRGYDDAARGGRWRRHCWAVSSG